MTPEERFWSKIDQQEDHWIWLGRPNAGGYGRMGCGGALVYAHVFSYRLLVGPIPDGLQIDHLCRLKLCVKPQHLEAVTHRINGLRGTGISARNAAKTHCINGHPFSRDNTYDWCSTRKCRTCVNAAAARYRERRRHQGITP